MIGSHADPIVRRQQCCARKRVQRMYFMRLWTISALASLVAMLVVLAAWLLVHLGFDDETMSLLLSYLTNVRLVLLAVAVSALIGLLEAVVMTSLYRRRRKRS